MTVNTVIFIIILLVLSYENTALSLCPSTWNFQWNSSCYKISTLTYLYGDAKVYCASEGGWAVTINSPAENVHLVSSFAISTSNRANIGYAYDSGTWSWHQGSSTYTNWHSGEPVDPSVYWMGFLGWYSDDVGKWSTGQIARKIICETNFIQDPPTISPTAAPTPFELGMVSRVAGSGTAGGANGIGTNARFNGPWKVVLSKYESFALITELPACRVRKFVVSTSFVSSFVGLDSTSCGAINGIGTNAQFDNPRGIAISHDDSFALVSDYNNNRIRHVVVSTAQVSTLVGSVAGNVNGVGTIVRLNGPRYIVLSSDDSFAITSDYTHNIIKKIVMSTLTVTPVAGGTQGALDGTGTNARFNDQVGVSLSPDDSYLLVADRGTNTVRKVVLSTALVTTIAGVKNTPGGLNGFGTSAKFNELFDIAIAQNGIFALVTDTARHEVRRIDLNTLQVITIACGSGTFGGANGVGTNAKMNVPAGIAIFQSSSVSYIVENDGHRLREVRFLMAQPTFAPTVNPTKQPTFQPSAAPTFSPTLSPTLQPTFEPTLGPTKIPTLTPTTVPTFSPTVSPTFEPTVIPTASPSSAPTLSPTATPTTLPTTFPDTVIRIDNLQQSEKYINLAEFKFYCGSNQVYPHYYRVSSTEPGYPLANAFDNDVTTFFHSRGSTDRDYDPFMEIHMTDRFDTILIWNRVDLPLRIVGARIQVLDGSTVVYTSTFAAGDIMFMFNIRNVGAVFKIDTGVYGDRYFNLADIIIYSKGVRVAPLSYQQSSTLAGGYSISNCFDDNVHG
jgi:hypothetical protein